VAKRGDRVAPPALKNEWTLLFATNDAAEGWEDLVRVAGQNLRGAWEHLSKNPRNREPNPSRVCHLKGTLGVREIKGSKLEQWQYEVTGAGRIWYCPDDSTKTVWITLASIGHPKATG
jgi:hypothetical protein